MTNVREFLERWRDGDVLVRWQDLCDAIKADEATPPNPDAVIRERLHGLTVRWNDAHRFMVAMGATKAAEGLGLLHAEVQAAMLPKGGAA